MHRYIWEGQLVADGLNPYSAPASDVSFSDRRDHHWLKMNHRDRPTAYPPGIQYILAATSLVSPSPMAFKILASVADLLVIFLILWLLFQEKLPLRWTCFYAYNPISLIAFAAEGHFDSVMTAAILATLLAARKGHFWTWIFLAFAIHVKVICIILAPLLFFGNLRKSSPLLPLFLFILAIPFLGSIPAWFSGLFSFVNSSEFNGPAFALLSTAGIPQEFVRSSIGGLYAIAAVSIAFQRWLGRSDLITCSLHLLSAFLLFSPIVHFWYLAWLLPLACLRPSFLWTTASISISAYFLAWQTQATHGWWGYEHKVALLIWLFPLIAGIAQNRFILSRLLSRPFTNGRPIISVIFPTLNPGKELLPAVSSIRRILGPRTEIIIADSSATLPLIPLDENIRLLSLEPGRGNQIAAGIEAARSDSNWFLIAHIDSLPEPSFFETAHYHALHDRHSSMLVCGQRFDRQNLSTLFVEFLNEIRVVFGGVAFGDQTMLIRRSALDLAGGFPAQALMEDVEVSMRLAAIGRITYLGKEWTLSARKWEKAYLKRIVFVVRLVAAYQLARLRGRDHAAITSRKMYEAYYPAVIEKPNN